MVWASKSVAAKQPSAQPQLLGVDLNATRACAVLGPASALPRILPLEEAREELPTVLSLERRQPQVGRAGWSLCRQAPHLACLDFLAYLGEDREWIAGRHRLDAARALALVLGRIQAAATGAKGAVIAVPAYLTRPQMAQASTAAEQAKLPVLGVVKTPLAMALAAHAAEPWLGAALAIEVDDHGLTAAILHADADQLWITRSQTWAPLGSRAWRNRLLDAVADRCIRQNRRDPRDSAAAEQALYEQIDDGLAVWAQERTVELLIQTSHWYQNLFWRPEDARSACSGLVRQTLEVVHRAGQSVSVPAYARVLVTASAALLPGLASALQDSMARSPERLPSDDSNPDFGEDLIAAPEGASVLTVLTRDIVARAAHGLAERIQRGELSRGPIDLTITLPRTSSAELPPASGRRGFRILSADADD